MDNKTNEMRNIVNDLFEEWEIIRVKMDSIPPSPADLADEEIMSELDSIDEIPNAVLELSDDEYSDMLSNVRALAPKLRNGEYTISAMEKALR